MESTRRWRGMACRGAPAVRGAAALVAVGALWGGLELAAGTTSAAAALRVAGGSAQAQAKKDLLVKSDMPKGWTATKNSDSGSSGLGTGVPAADEQLASCLDVPAGVVEGAGRTVSSPQFNSPGDQLYGVTDAVVVFNSAKDARAQMVAYGRAQAASCLQSEAQGPYRNKIIGNIPKGVTFGTMTFNTADPSVIGPHAAGVVAHVPLTSQGVTLPLTFSQVVLAKGRLVQEISFYSFVKAFPVAVERHLISVAAGRIGL